MVPSLKRVIVGLMVFGVMASGGCAKIGLGSKSKAANKQSGAEPKLSASVYNLGTAPMKTNESAAASTISAPTTGVATPAYKLKAGDPVVVFLRGIPPADQQFEDVVDEDGNLKFPFIGAVMARGKTSSQLENDIEKEYVDQQIYKNITVNVVLPSQSYFVRGEVKQAGRFPLITGVTVVQAIASAGGYSEFAEPTKVKIIRGEKVKIVNVKDFEKHPERDQYLEPGDVIVVPRSIF